MNNFYQIILKPYNKIPEFLKENFKKDNQEWNHIIYDDQMGYNFILENFDKKDKILEAFINGNGKWKCDLLRLCILNKLSGYYLDVDLVNNKKINEFNIPEEIDTTLCLGAFTPVKGINPLPKGEFAIGFIICKTPEPLFLDYIKTMGALVVSTGNPYAINIQGLYVFLCKRWNIDFIEPFKIYTDNLNNRKYYFLKEVKMDNKFKIINKNNDIIVHSQELPKKYFI